MNDCTLPEVISGKPDRAKTKSPSSSIVTSLGYNLYLLYNILLKEKRSLNIQVSMMLLNKTDPLITWFKMQPATKVTLLEVLSGK